MNTTPIPFKDLAIKQLHHMIETFNKHMNDARRIESDDDLSDEQKEAQYVKIDISLGALVLCNEQWFPHLKCLITDEALQPIIDDILQRWESTKAIRQLQHLFE